MTPRNYSNISVQTTLAAGITAVDLALTVSDATGYPSVPFAIVVDAGSTTSEEVMLVTAKAAAVFTVTRAYDGTTAKVHAAGATVIHAAIADDFRGKILGTREVATTAPAAGQALIWNNGAAQWEPGSAGVTSHAALTGLAANDHTQYGLLAAANTWTLGPNTFLTSANGDAIRIGPDTNYQPGGLAFTRLVDIRDASSTGFVAGTNGSFYIAHDARFALSLTDPITTPFAIVYGGNFEVDIGANAGANIFSVTALNGLAYWEGPADLSALQGLQFYANNYGAGNISTMYGIYIDASTYAGTVGTAYGQYIEVDYSSAPITTKYGLFIGNQVNIATNPFSIYTDGGAHRFGDYLDLAEITTPGSPSNTHGRLFCRDVAGKTQLCVKFTDGTVVVLAVQP